MNTKPKIKLSKMALREERWAWLFIAAPFVGFLCFMAYPIVFAVIASMSTWTGINNMWEHMVGFQNYAKIFGDPKFWTSLLNTVIYMIGIPLGMILGIVIAMIFAQNLLSIGLAKLVGVDNGIGLSTGSIPMVGGHGTSAALGPILEDFGFKGATTICSAAATFGLVMGSLMGGPLAQRRIRKHNLTQNYSVMEKESEADEEAHHPLPGKYATATYQLAIAIGLGTILSWLLSLTGLTFPVYIGGMLVAAIMRNLSEHISGMEMRMGEINEIGNICLTLFLGIAMITLKLWQLADLALPLILLLTGQTVLMFIFAYFIVFNLMGRDYDAAVLSAGFCGFGMGATPNAMANMQAITQKYHPSIKAYIIIPIVGSMFADFINSLVITMFINSI